MDERELAAQLALLLAEELADRIPDLDRVVLALEREPASAELQRELHRLIHVVKGASRSAGVVEVESSCHALETLLAATEPGEPVPSATLGAATALIAELGRVHARLAGGPGDGASTVAPTAEAEPDSSVRVAAHDLDQLLVHSAAVLVARQGLGEPIEMLDSIKADLASARTLTSAQLVALSRKLGAVGRALKRSHGELALASNILEDEVRRIRLRSIGDACQGCERLVHDTAAMVGKEVDLIVVGAGVRIDRSQIEVVRDALVQLVRNSVAHGIEAPDVRARLGKKPRGNVTIEAEIAGDVVRVTVSDDGAGLDLAAIRERSLARGIRVDTAEDAKRAIFSAGLSTASSVTELSGRGVGLDVVKHRIESLHGSITVDSIAGQGTAFRIELPTTVATMTALVIGSGEGRYVVASSAVERILRVRSSDVRHAEGRARVRVGETWVPVASLAALLGGSPGNARDKSDRMPALVVTHGGRRAVVLVEQTRAMADVTVGPLDPRLGRIRHIAGQTRLPSGEIALVLNPGDLVEDVLETAAAPPPPPPAVARHRIMVVDDSVTTRTLEANILRTAGYEVVLAVDGAAALAMLSDNFSVDVIVSDIDMPNLDGFGLTRAVRDIERLATIPIILVTARGNEEDRARGMRAGANAYLVKSSFDQTVLLQTIARLL